MSVWDVLPDTGRQQWTLDPFVGVGPLRFGMSGNEASVALGGLRPADCRHDPRLGITWQVCRGAGLKLYFAADAGLCGVAADALRGPQVLAEGTALVARVPSEVERWVFDRADAREPFAEAFYMPGGEVGSLTLGVVLCVQRAGDRLLTRPVLLSADVLDDAYHRLPVETWRIS
ncbi:hypothetical protein ABZ766_19030 [Streptomyces sp. NPDC006670]|uniref:hypothetical protein n=1 Tax=Streptomyces sp. NPDC006670 TaxID=3154476 RepID=UPI0033DADCFD